MERSHILSLTWPIRSRTGDQLDDTDSWPELSQTNQLRHSTKRNSQDSQCVFDSTRLRIIGSRNLDESEYPQLGESVNVNRHSASVDKSRIDTNKNTSIPSKMIIEMRKSKPGKRCRRTDKICINLQEALESTRCLKKINTKEPMKFRVNIYKSNQSTSATKASNNNETPNIKKIKICISKAKRPSKLKKIILLDREINARKREIFEAQKMDAITRDVNSINFNALKITGDAEADRNYVKRMATLTIYGKKYRDPINKDGSANSLCHRSDVLDKLSNLRIQDKSALCKYTSGNNKDIFRMCESIIEDDILKRATALGINNESEQDIKDRTISDIKPVLGYSHNCREYCSNIVKSSLNESLDKFLSEIARLQRKHYDKDHNKAKYRRRYYSGLKEVRKHVHLRKEDWTIKLKCYWKPVGNRTSSLALDCGDAS